MRILLLRKSLKAKKPNNVQRGSLGLIKVYPAEAKTDRIKAGFWLKLKLVQQFMMLASCHFVSPTQVIEVIVKTQIFYFTTFSTIQ